jgi:hypothetical protein
VVEAASAFLPVAAVAEVVAEEVVAVALALAQAVAEVVVAVLALVLGPQRLNKPVRRKAMRR